MDSIANIQLLWLAMMPLLPWMRACGLVRSGHTSEGIAIGDFEGASVRMCAEGVRGAAHCPADARVSLGDHAVARVALRHRSLAIIFFRSSHFIDWQFHFLGQSSCFTCVEAAVFSDGRRRPR